MMRTPVGHRAARVLPPITETEVRAFFDVRDVGRLTLPEVVVETSRNWRRFERTLTQAGRQPDFDPFDLTDPAVANQIASQPKLPAAPLLGARLQHLSCFSLYLDQSFALVNGQGQRFLAIDVFPCLHGADGHQGVPVVDRTANHRVNIFAFQQFAKISEAVRVGKVLFGGGKLVAVHVTDCNDLAESL